MAGGKSKNIMANTGWKTRSGEPTRKIATEHRYLTLGYFEARWTESYYIGPEFRVHSRHVRWFKEPAELSASRDCGAIEIGEANR